MIACKPLSAMMFRSLSAGPVGWVSPCSHLRMVDADVCRRSANTGWLNLRLSRRRLMSAAWKSLTGGGADRIELAHCHLVDGSGFVKRFEIFAQRFNDLAHNVPLSNTVYWIRLSCACNRRSYQDSSLAWPQHLGVGCLHRRSGSAADSMSRGRYPAPGALYIEDQEPAWGRERDVPA